LSSIFKGFKSDEERQAYIASLGDPEEHPLFAQTAEDCKDHPLVGAFRYKRSKERHSQQAKPPGKCIVSED
jgi:hypothetical protein